MIFCQFSRSAFSCLRPDGGQPIEARAAIVFAEAPLGGDPALLLHAMERGIERAFFHAQDIVGNALDVQRDSPAMHGVLLEAFQDEKRQGSLKGVIFRFAMAASPIDVYRRSLGVMARDVKRTYFAGVPAADDGRRVARSAGGRKMGVRC